MKKHKKEKPVHPVMPVKKPGGAHMPVCLTPGCKRKVEDARKGNCGICQKKASGNVKPWQGVTMEDYEMYGPYGMD